MRGLKPSVYHTGRPESLSPRAMFRVRSRWEIYRTAPFFSNHTLTFFNANPSFITGSPAVRTLLPAVWGGLGGIGSFAFLHKKLFLHAVVQVVPREHLIELPVAVGVKGRVQAAGSESSIHLSKSKQSSQPSKRRPNSRAFSITAHRRRSPRAKTASKKLVLAPW